MCQTTAVYLLFYLIFENEHIKFTGNHHLICMWILLSIHTKKNCLQYALVCVCVFFLNIQMVKITKIMTCTLYLM